MLGLPTGSSPVLVYQNLVQRHRAGDISFRNVVTFNMVRCIGLQESRLPCLAVWHSSMALNQWLTSCRTSTSGSRVNTPKATIASCTSISSPT